MKVHLLNFLLLLLATNVIAMSRKSTDFEKLPLSIEIYDHWEFRQVGEKNWYPAVVPGSVHTDLIYNGLIDDPYYRLIEHDVQWVDKKDWEYKAPFQLSDNILNRDVIKLIFEGLDTYAKIYLNDKFLLETDNMFRSYEIDCKKYLVKGENELKIILLSPTQQGSIKYDKLNYTLPVSANDLSAIGGMGNKKVSIFSRKAGYHFGWDWGPRIVTSGIWRPINIVAWNKSRISNVFIKDKSINKEKATLQSSIQIEASKDFYGEFLVYIDSKYAECKSFNFVKGLNDINLDLFIENPTFWWPNGLGEPNMHEITIELWDSEHLIDCKSVQKGLRTVDIIQNKDTKGFGMAFHINGIPVFAKGVNYIPQDIFLNRVSPEDYERLIKAVVDANMNMIRVWGGGIYENEMFYELCDQYGIMVWQDFMFACAMFPGDKAFLENVRLEAEENVIRLRNHPSVVMWCGNNEILSAWKNWGWEKQITQEYGEEISKEIWQAYDTVFHHILPEAVNSFDSLKFYWASSPSAANGIQENWTSGDVHYWGVWWGKEPFENYEKKIPRFMSEFGFQSFPDFNTEKKYTAPEDWDIYSEVMKSHQRSSIGNVTIAEYMDRDYKTPKNFEMFLYVSHLLQAKGIKTGIEAHRRNMPYCMGSLYWQLNDCWPVASWSGIDYYGNWKALHYTVKKAFEPVKISFERDSNQLHVFIISDKLQDIQANLELRLLDFYGNQISTFQSNPLVEANQSKIYLSSDINVLIKGKSINELVLEATLKDDMGKKLDQNIYYFVAPKDLSLPEPNLGLQVRTISTREISLELSSDQLAKNVYFQTPISGHFSNNYFDLLPGGKMQIRFKSKEILERNQFRKSLKMITLKDSFDVEN